MTTLHFSLLALSHFIIFDSDDALISCQLCKSNTLWNIFIILGRIVEQDLMMCPVQERHWSYLPSFCFEIDFISAHQLKYPLEYFDGIW